MSVDLLNQKERALYHQVIDKNLFNLLSDEIILNIFSFLPILDLTHVGMSCKRLKIISDDNQIWKNFYKTMYPEEKATYSSYKELLEILIPLKFSVLKSKDDYASIACFRLLRLKLIHLDDIFDDVKKMPINDQLSFWDNCLLLGSECLYQNMPDRAETICRNMQQRESKKYLIGRILNYYFVKNDYLKLSAALISLAQNESSFEEIIYKFFGKILTLKEFAISFNFLKEVSDSRIKNILAHVLNKTLLSENENTFIDELEQLLSTFKDNNENRVNVALFYAVINDLDTFLKEAILITHPRSKLSCYNLSLSYFKNHNNVEALIHINNIIDDLIATNLNP